LSKNFDKITKEPILIREEERNGMKIEHIFNKVKSDKSGKEKLINSQEFKGNFWLKKKDKYSPPKKNLSSDFARLYYHGLVPENEEDKTIISKYDNDKLERLTNALGDELILISGDFWGIQKFIFDGVTTSKASKILRSRSAMVQLITYAVVEEIKHIFKGSESLLFGAGKFTVLAKKEKDYKKKINNLQQELDSYFLKNFFGQNGFIISFIEIEKDILLKPEDNKHNREKILDELGRQNELNKFKKFDLLNIENDETICINVFENANIDDNNSCKFCNKRITNRELEEEACSICYNQINLGKQLTTNDYINIIKFGKLRNHKEISKKLIEIIKFSKRSYFARFSNYKNHYSWGKTFNISNKEFDEEIDKWALNSYVLKGDFNSIKSFDEYIKDNNGKTVSSGLMALKADIDKLGDTFRELYKEDFRVFNRLSREVDYFFSEYITSLLENKKVYTIFAGGDDLFLIGEYREIVNLAKEIRKEFLVFSLGKTTISMGLVMFKPTTPINFVSDMTDEAEKRAKIERDSIDIFGVSIKFDEFCKIEKEFNQVTDFLESYSKDTSSLYYRLIELCEMKDNLDRALRGEIKFNPKDALWKSKLNYIFRRNIKKRDNDSEIFNKLSRLIEKGEKFKPSIFLKIYNNRDDKNNKENINANKKTYEKY